MRRPATVGTLAYVLLGPLVWAVHVSVIYGAQSMLCALAGPWDPAAAIRAVIALVTLLALGLVAAAAVNAGPVALALGAGSWPETSRVFHRRAMRLLAILSFLGMMASGAAALLPVCAPLR